MTQMKNYTQYIHKDNEWRVLGGSSSGNNNIVNGSKTGSLRTIGSKEEDSNYTIGENAFAEGYHTKASGNRSHAEGYGTIASGNQAHAEGYETAASGNHAHTEGRSTLASSPYQHVEGKFNIEDTDETYAHIVGNGSSSARSNAYTLDWDGNGEYAGKITVGSGPINNMDVATKKYVDDSITALPEPMIFKGSLGTSGTITTLPAASASNEGYTYKVITAGTYASQVAKIGDTFISDGSSWILIPSGDEPSGTVTSITLNATSPIAIDNSGAITTSGTRTLSHANSGVSAGTYKSVTVNATGHVTAGTNPTTLSGYGITDAKIASGTITLGSNTITPITTTDYATTSAAGIIKASDTYATVVGSSNGALYANQISYADFSDLSSNAFISKGTLNNVLIGRGYVTTDTKNTAGSTNSSSKLFLIGATSQAANPQTYSQDTAYVGTDGHLYSNSKQVVNLSDSQALTNKTYNGYTLNAASAKAVDTSISEGTSSTNLPTSAAVANYAPIKIKTGTNGAATITNKIDMKSDAYDGVEFLTRADKDANNFSYSGISSASNDEQTSENSLYSYIKKGSATKSATISTYVSDNGTSLDNSEIRLGADDIYATGNIVVNYGQPQNTVTINGVVTPTSNTMAANKKYVDDAVASITPTIPNATSTTVGGIKMRLDTDTNTLYITNDGSNA